MTSVLKKELVRKSIHMASVFVPICYMLTDFSFSIITFIILLNLFLIFDLLRLKTLKDSGTLEKFFIVSGISGILREHEKNRISGASYLFLGAFICITFAPKIIFVIAFFILAFSDSAAAIVGKKFGKYKVGDKTLEGALAFFIASIFTALTILMLYNVVSLQFIAVLLVAIIATTFTELYISSKKLDDNLIIPLVFCLSCSLLSVFLS